MSFLSNCIITNCSYIINEEDMESDSECECEYKDGNELSLEASVSANANANADKDGNVERDRDSDGNGNEDDDGGGVSVPIEEGKEAGREAKGQAFASTCEDEMIRSGLSMDTAAGSNGDSPRNGRSTRCFCRFKMLTATHPSS